MTLDYEAFHQRLLVFRISLHPGTRIIPGEEGTVVEIPIWYARRGEETATAETPIEAVEKLVQILGQGVARTRVYVRTTESQGGIW